MGRFLMGKELSSMTKEEIDEAMAKMRAARKNGNGRLGLKNPDAQMFSTNNFPIEGKEHQPFARGTKYKHEHIKSIFVCARELYSKKTAYSQTPIYLIGFLSDTNRISFEEFRDYVSSQVKFVTDEQTYRLQKFHQMFSKKNIDKDTFISIDLSGISKNEFIYKQIKLMCSFTDSRLKEVSDADIIRFLLRKFKVYKTRYTYNNCVNYNKRKINETFIKIYKFLASVKVCPWITDEELNFLKSVHMHKRHSYMTVELGLFFTVLRKFDALMRKTKIDFKKDKESV